MTKADEMLALADCIEQRDETMRIMKDQGHIQRLHRHEMALACEALRAAARPPAVDREARPLMQTAKEAGERDPATIAACAKVAEKLAQDMRFNKGGETANSIAAAIRALLRPAAGEASPLMQIAKEAGERVAGWSDAKQDYAARATAPTDQTGRDPATIEALRSALRGCECPRPFNGEPDDLTVGQCIDKGQCGCVNGAALAAPAAPAEVEAQRQSFVRGMTARCEHGELDFEQCPKCRG